MTKTTKPPITVRELIAELQKLPADNYVFTEGCDCVGSCAGVELLDSPPYTGAARGNIVLLMRDDNRKVPDAAS